MLDKMIFSKVRLKPGYLIYIVLPFEQNFASEDHLWIFGSRTNMTAKGGDIDLYVEISETDTEVVYQRKIKFVVALTKKIGEQKIDVIVKMLKSNIQLPIYDEAYNTWVKLI